MTPDRFKQLYSKYLNNICTEEERNELLNYIYASGNPELLDDVESISSKDKMLSDASAEEVWQNIVSIIKPKKSRISSIYKYTAVAVIILVLGFAVLEYWRKDENAFVDWITNNTNEIIQVPLLDGTLVYLKPGSKVTYKPNFQFQRDVSIEGEAFFAVAHDSLSPFIVHLASNIKLRVLGTRFNVKTGARINDVVLTEGKLAISNNKEMDILLPSDRIFIASNAMLKSTVDTLKYNSWINNQIYFDNQSLSNVVSSMKVYYPHINISVTTSNQSLRFTGYLPTDNYELLKEILIKTFKYENLITI